MLLAIVKRNDAHDFAHGFVELLGAGHEDVEAVVYGIIDHVGGSGSGCQQSGVVHLMPLSSIQPSLRSSG